MEKRNKNWLKKYNKNHIYGNKFLTEQEGIGLFYLLASGILILFYKQYNSITFLLGAFTFFIGWILIRFSNQFRNILFE